MIRFRIYQIFVCIAALLHTNAIFATFKPILPLELEKIDNPLLELTIKTNPLIKGWIEDDIEAKETTATIKIKQKTLKKKKGKNRLKETKTLFILSSRLANYYNKKAKEATKSASKSYIKKYFEYAKVSSYYAKALAKTTKKRKSKNDALYTHYTTNMIIDPASYHENIQKLVEIKDFASPKIRQSINTLIAISFIETPLTLTDGVKILNKNLMTASHKESINIHFYLAKALAGIGPNFDRINNKADPRYINHIKLGLKKAATMPQDIKAKALTFGILIWKAAQNDPTLPRWSSLKLNLNAYMASPIASAIIERKLLESFDNTNHSLLIHGYKNLKSSSTKALEKLKFDKRIIEIGYDHFKTTKNHHYYEKSLITELDRVKKEGTKKSGYKEYGLMLRKRYIALIDFLLTQALRKGNTEDFRRSIIASAIKLIKTLDTKTKNITIINEKISMLYYSIQDYKNSVRFSLYLYNIDKKVKHLKRAIISQSMLANWPLAIHWKLAKKESTKFKERKKLLDIYKLLIKSYPKQKAPLSHTIQAGILKINQGDIPGGFKELLTAMNIDPNSKLGGEAAGFMLNSYYGIKDWKNFLAIASIVQKRKAKATFGGKPFSLNTKVPEALFFTGKSYLTKHKHKDAIGYLNIYTKSYPKHKNHDEGLFILANIYNTTRTKSKDLEMLHRLVKEHPNSQYLKKALVLGGNWATKQHQPLYIFYFYEVYLMRFKNSKDVPIIRKILAKEYTKNKRYSKATNVLRKQILDPKATKTDRIDAALMYIDIEEKYGDYKEGMWPAKKILELAPANDLLKSRVLGFYSRYAVKKKDLNWLMALKKELEAIKKKKLETHSNIGLVKLTILNMTTKAVTPTEQLTKLKDPKQSIQHYFNEFLKIQAKYEIICQKPTNLYCAPAKIMIGTHSTHAAKAISSIELPSNLDQNTIENFKIYKHQYLVKLRNLQTQSFNAAYQLAKQGNTTPKWKEEILSIMRK